MRRYGLYFMSSRRSEVLRRFCGGANGEGESSLEEVSQGAGEVRSARRSAKSETSEPV